MTQAIESARTYGLGSTPSEIVPTSYLTAKRLFCPLIAAVLFIPASLMMAVLIAIIRFTSPGPAILRQTRVGKDGRTFVMYKLRTMCADAEARTGPVWSQRDDPRITPIGHVMRSLHLDELPQLINVIRGEMSLVGPRPERPEFVDIPGRRNPRLPRSAFRTAWDHWPGTNPPAARRERGLCPTEADPRLHYIETASPLMDLRVVICSLFRMMGLPGLMSARLLGFQVSLCPAASFGSRPRCCTAFRKDVAVTRNRFSCVTCGRCYLRVPTRSQLHHRICSPSGRKDPAFEFRGYQGAMNILFLVHRVPHPPNKGDRIRSYQLLRFLSGCGDVHLACLADEPVSLESRVELSRLCRQVSIIPVNRRGRYLSALTSMARGRSATEGLFESSRLRLQHFRLGPADTL